MSEYITPIVLSAILYVLSFAMFADIAVNGVLLTPGRTFAVLAFAGIAVIMATVVSAIVTSDILARRRTA